MAGPLRIGAVPYINARPLVWGLEEKAEVRYDVPSKLAGMLREGEVDVALVPFVEYFSGTRYTIVPDISIASHGPIRSVLLVCQADPYDLKRIAVDTHSLSSAAMLKVIATMHYRLKPEYIQMDVAAVGIEGALKEGADSVLIIGDPALKADPGPHYVVDLGEEWTILTNFSFVYAAWLARDGVDLEAATELLAAAKREGLANLDAIAEKAAAEIDLPVDSVSAYLGGCVVYDLGESELKGIDFFRKHGLELGAIERDEDIRIYNR